MSYETKFVLNSLDRLVFFIFGTEPVMRLSLLVKLLQLRVATAMVISHTQISKLSHFFGMKFFRTPNLF